MRPRFRGVAGPTVYVAPPRPPQGGSGGSDASSPEPEYRWTFKTWIDHLWEDYSGRKRSIEDERTMTVIASTEAAAKVKIESALPAIPTGDSGYQKHAYTRHWELQGAIEEVTP